MKVIFLMMIGMSLLQADFIKEGDTVKDTQSNLEWQDNEVGSGTTWENAIEKCENLELAGHNDWRLPNINELKSIADISKYNPAIVKVFKNTISFYYWSSTTYEGHKNDAWFIYFSDSHTYKNSKEHSYYVKCVRDGE